MADDSASRPARPAAAGVPIMRKLGMEPDPWQREVLEGEHPRLILNCCRQAGKSTAIAVLALVKAMFEPGSLVLLLSRSQRQSAELFREVRDFYLLLGAPYKKRLSAYELQLSYHSRVVSLPCNAQTVRGFSRVALLVIDEATVVPDDLYRTVRPMPAVSGGRLVLLSTPYGKRGFFYETWAKGGDRWKRIEVPAAALPRITPDFLAEEREALSESWFRQEYCCSFEALVGLVYPDFARCAVPGPAPEGKLVGGIDFGFRNSFAAVWGMHDRDGVLWLTGEHYARQKPLSYHAGCLPKKALWWADPSGRRRSTSCGSPTTTCSRPTTTSGWGSRR